jgi:16S rRNA (cytosine1402-N4)-methyltransferase
VPPEAHVLVHQIWLGKKRKQALESNYSAEELNIVQRDIGDVRVPRIGQHLHEPLHPDEARHRRGVDEQPGECGVDATLGWGGHAQRFLDRLSPGGRLLALDADPIELPKTETRLRRLGFGEETLLVRRTNFAGLRGSIDEVGWSDGVDFVFADLGVSSMQIDDPARGFSFKVDGPLDMRMNPKRGLSAAQWLDRASVDTLTTALEEDADEPRAREIATSVVAHRVHHGAITTTRALADAVLAALGSRVPIEEADLTVRRVFQALRIEVNDEFGVLDALLRQLPGCLRPGGRAAVISFHSGEDRRVKKAFEDGERAGLYARVSREVIRASPAEQRHSGRSR